MSLIIAVTIRHEVDVVAVRQRARRIAELIGFETHDQTRVATAVSEIARNALFHAKGGKARFEVVDADSGPRLVVIISDGGEGISDVAAVLAGRAQGSKGRCQGMIGARRLMDHFDVVTSQEAGTTVTLGKSLRHMRALDHVQIDRIAKIIANEEAGDPLAEIRAQNSELLHSLEELNSRQEESLRLNAELESTNRGVVALYAELDHRAAELRSVNENLEERIAAAIAERAELEESLRQSQKMEAVGQLTGGIAHDFNNLLQIVIGNLDILSRNLPEDAARLRRVTGNAMEGAKRAAVLTHRLLAFSRRQPLAPKPIDINDLVAGMSDLFHRTLGEPVDVKTVLAADLWTVEADPNQLENALINLAINARDAMPEGGCLSIQTSNARLEEAFDCDNVEMLPGDYVVVSVVDTGVGMSHDTLSRVFEPFFTTKDVGQGTGLGLSMVYGFVRQSSGHVKIESHLGRGTEVKIYLPRLVGISASPEEVVGPGVPETGNDALILVVEDDDGVRSYSSEVLRDLGYRVIEAADAAQGLQALRVHAGVDLLFTDVVLPKGKSGRQLAEEARAICPALKVLFTSGYARDSIVHDGRVDPDVQMISKPFMLSDLAARIRTILREP